MSELEDLRRDVIELREWKHAVLSKCRACDGFDALPWGGDKEGWGFIHYFIGHLETRALEAEKHLPTPPQAVQELISKPSISEQIARDIRNGTFPRKSEQTLNEERQSDDLCQCSKCGRMHKSLGFGKPPHHISEPPTTKGEL